MNIESLHSGHVLKRIDQKTKIVVVMTRNKIACDTCKFLLAQESNVATTFTSGNNIRYRECAKCYGKDESNQK